MKKKSKATCTKHVEYRWTNAKNANELCGTGIVITVRRRGIFDCDDEHRHECVRGRIECKICRPVKITYEFIRRIPR